MAFYRCGGGGIPSSLKTDMNAVFNKKFGTAVDYPPEGWPDDVNLMGPLPEKTIVSSPIADFSDGADDVLTKSLIVTIPPTLDGKSSVSEKHTGRNLLPDTNYMTNYFSVADNGVVSQITTGASYAWSYANCIFKTTLPAGTYTAIEELVTDSTNASHGVQVFNSSNNMIGRVSSGAKTAGTYSATFTLTQATDIGIVCQLYNGKAKLYIVSGSASATYESYNGTQYTASLGRTIYGGQVDIVNGTGTDENGNDFTFDGQEINTRLGYNAFWSDSGDTEVTYRADINLALGGQ